MFFNKEFFHYVSLLGFLGFLIAANILVFVYLYKLFEKYFFKSHILFIIFVCIGVFSGFYNAYKTIMKK
ncbi:MAG: AtpZ/AtpI family protein [Cetobacterium sp.]|uniref:AtpZ/AtpI family protein n=1 Tax=Cetobacterium ceti TaxID=180163 RepID=UPI00099B02AB|nr:AtpZ/AtpI family protein [Cetobacterium ceti]MCJ8341288.1 AtpZ/AtpI family protein [Cetobacterium sp.]